MEITEYKIEKNIFHTPLIRKIRYLSPFIRENGIDSGNGSRIYSLVNDHPN